MNIVMFLLARNTNTKSEWIAIILFLLTVFTVFIKTFTHQPYVGKQNFKRNSLS